MMIGEYSRIATVLLLVSQLFACASNRPAPPPAGEVVEPAWGTVPILSEGVAADANLKIYARLTNDDVYKRRGLLSIMRAGAAYDTAPLRETLSSLITEEILDLVATEHRAGRRLFVGSTNLDANMFTIWDLGAIAG